jgi:phage portal protein BeeE
VRESPLLAKLADKLNANAERVGKLLFCNCERIGGVIEAHSKPHQNETVDESGMSAMIARQHLASSTGWVSDGAHRFQSPNFSAVRVDLISTQITAEQYNTAYHKTPHLNTKKVVQTRRRSARCCIRIRC